MRSVASLLLVILLASCATPYQATGLAGGYSDAQLDKNVFRVTFQGNGFTEPQRAADFTLMRSAELTLKAGFTHFAIVSGASRTDYTTHTTPRQATTTGTATAVGNTAYVTANTTYSGGQTFLIAAPSTTNTIVCFVGRPEGGGMVYDARFLFSSLTRKYGVASPSK